MTGGTQPTLARAFRRAALPLGWYYAVTLALPLANGAAQPGTVFVEHALAVLMLPPLLVALAWAVHRLAHSFRRRTSTLMIGRARACDNCRRV